MNTQSHEEDQVLKDLFQRSSSASGEGLKRRILEEVAIKKEVFEYQPVISKKGWLMILSCLSGLMFYLFTYDNRLSPDHFEFKWFTQLTDWSFPANIFRSVTLSISELPFSFLIGLVALIIFGLYFIIDMKLTRRFSR